MEMRIDERRRDKVAGGVYDSTCIGRDRRLDSGDLAAGNADIGDTAIRQGAAFDVPNPGLINP